MTMIISLSDTDIQRSIQFIRSNPAFRKNMNIRDKSLDRLIFMRNRGLGFCFKFTHSSGEFKLTLNSDRTMNIEAEANDMFFFMSAIKSMERDILKLD